MKTALVLLGTALVAAGCNLVAVTLVVPGGLEGWRVVAGVALPVSVTWSSMAAYVVWSARAASRSEKDLSAQLTRREIELGRTSTVDELTGLATRREFDAMVRLEFGRFQRHQHPTTLLMLELDDIGELGEAAGLLTRGLAVAELASILKQSLRTIDVGCRFTETVIAILLLETSVEQARSVTDRIRAAVANQNVRCTSPRRKVPAYGLTRCGDAGAFNAVPPGLRPGGRTGSG